MARLGTYVTPLLDSVKALFGRTTPRGTRRSDDEWLDLLIRSVDQRVVDGITFPAFPAAEVQARFVGSAYADALREASQFYRTIRSSMDELGTPMRRDSTVLDFGCGWGRYLRFFANDIDEPHLFGCDVLSDILDVCRDTGVPGQLSQIEPLGRLPYADATFDVIMAYSVFTHLPAHVHEHWTAEFKRVAKPGCVVVFTVEPRRFIDFIVSIPEDAPSGWHQGLRRFAPEAERLYREHDTAEVAYIPTGGGAGLDPSHYGDAIVSKEYLAKAWGPEFEVHRYIDEPARFWQAVAVLRRV